MTFPKVIFQNSLLNLSFSNRISIQIHGKVDAKLFPSNIRFYIILMHDDVYYGPHYSASKAKSHYKHAHNIYIMNNVIVIS